jgi:hypothetical protein
MPNIKCHNKKDKMIPKNIPKIPDLKGIGIGQDLSTNRSKIAYLARQAVKQKQIKSTEPNMFGIHWFSICG